MIAERHGHIDFKASNGWLHRWETRNNIKQRSIVDESTNVSVRTDKSWRKRRPEIFKDYDPKVIWNLNEMGCFCRALRDKGLGKIKGECKGGKTSKHKVTITFFVNAAGESDHLPIVIWKSCNLRCFKGIK